MLCFNTKSTCEPNMPYIDSLFMIDYFIFIELTNLLTDTQILR